MGQVLLVGDVEREVLESEGPAKSGMGLTKLPRSEEVEEGHYAELSDHMPLGEGPSGGRAHLVEVEEHVQGGWPLASRWRISSGKSTEHVADLFGPSLLVAVKEGVLVHQVGDRRANGTELTRNCSRSSRFRATLVWE